MDGTTGSAVTVPFKSLRYKAKASGTATAMEEHVTYQQVQDFWNQKNLAYINKYDYIIITIAMSAIVIQEKTTVVSFFNPKSAIAYPYTYFCRLSYDTTIGTVGATRR